MGDDRLCISVTDTGIGISPTAIPHLFDDYMQADASIGNKYGGTGIGLALTRKFSVLLGGGISVESMPGKGSRFTIDISANLRDELKERRPIDIGSAEVRPVWQGNAG
jgi:signal transduction histidine kinase